MLKKFFNTLILGLKTPQLLHKGYKSHLFDKSYCKKFEQKIFKIM